MQPIDNTGLLSLNQNIATLGFTPAATYAYDAEAETMTVTEGSTFPDGVDLETMRVQVVDDYGTIAKGTISAAEGNVVIDVSGLDPLKGLSVTAVIVTDNRLTGDLSAYQIGSTAPVSGNLRYVNKNG